MTDKSRVKNLIVLSMIVLLIIEIALFGFLTYVFTIGLGLIGFIIGAGTGSYIVYSTIIDEARKAFKNLE